MYQVISAAAFAKAKVLIADRSPEVFQFPLCSKHSSTASISIIVHRTLFENANVSVYSPLCKNRCVLTKND